jgi:hypothetical protein
MSASISQPRPSLPVWLGGMLWLGAFSSPTAYFFLVLLADGYHIPGPPVVIVGALFCLMPIVALIICGSVVWRSSKKLGVRIGGLLFTLIAMAIQVGFILIVLRAIIVARIGYAQ